MDKESVDDVSLDEESDRIAIEYELKYKMGSEVDVFRSNCIQKKWRLKQNSPKEKRTC